MASISPEGEQVVHTGRSISFSASTASTASTACASSESHDHEEEVKATNGLPDANSVTIASNRPTKSKPALHDAPAPAPLAASSTRSSNPSHPVDRPLHTYSDAAFRRAYKPSTASQPNPTTAKDLTPPHNPTEHFYPILSQFERARLDKLFAITQGIEEDEELMDHIRLLAKLAPTVTGYEEAMVGLISNSHYTQINSSSSKAVKVPRREAVCSHTIVSTPRGVDDLPNLACDWRFSGNPHVIRSGMQAYAGTPLLYDLPESQMSLPMGSLCVVSYRREASLNQDQKLELQRIARSITHVITSAAREKSLARQIEMQKFLMTLKASSHNPDSVMAAIKQAVKIFFPTCIISFQAVQTEFIRLTDVGPISLTEFKNCVWENEELINYFIQEKNHIEWTRDVNSCTVRAIAVQSSDYYIVLQSSDLRTTFDPSVDTIFVQHCALVLDNLVQHARLLKAVDVKAAFLRDVQHSIRTSLNGILSASEMLLDDEEEAERTGMKTILSNRTDSHRQPVRREAPDHLLSVIDTSGRKLLRIINNLLQLDRTSGNLKPTMEECSVYDLEEEIVEAILLGTERVKFTRTVLLSDNRVEPAFAKVTTDRGFLRQAILSIVQNAVDAVEGGSVRVRYDCTPEGLLGIEVQDSGPGIPEALQQKIFEPFFKINTFTSTAGLGLAFTDKYVQALGGTASIVSSSPENGTLFRLQVPVKCITNYQDAFAAVLRFHTTYYIDDETPITRHYAAILDRLGYKQTTSTEADIILQTDYQIPSKSPPPAVLNKHAVTIRYLTGSDARKKYATLDKNARLITCGHPMGRNKIMETLRLAQEYLGGIEVSDTRPLLLPRTSISPPVSSLALAGTAQAASSASVARQQKDDKLRILNVDDNDINLRIIQTFCMKRKYSCVNARNGDEAVDLYIQAHQAGEPFSFIAMDYEMPVCNGAEATQKIRQYEQEHKTERAAIYIITGQSGEEEQKLSLAAGCDAFWVKPLRVRLLDDTLATLFS